MTRVAPAHKDISPANGRLIPVNRYGQTPVTGYDKRIVVTSVRHREIFNEKTNVPG